MKTPSATSATRPAHRAGRSLAALSLLLSLGLPLPALAAGGVELKTEAFHEVEVEAPSGKKEKKLETLTRAAPGQEVVYVITYHNTGDKPADKVVVNNPLPKEMVFVPGSAQGDNTKAEVSVDGGQKFGALEALRVKNADGTLRPATAKDVTNVRWTVVGAVKPGSTGSVTYRAVLK